MVDSYTPGNSIEVSTTYQVDLDADPSGDWYCVLGGSAEFDYTYFLSFSADSQTTIQPRQPQDLKSVPPDVFTYNGPGDYLRTRIWQVWDNYDLPWTYGNFPVTESYAINQNGCNIQIISSNAATNNQGRFQDRYGNIDGSSVITACAQFPACTTQATQTITVAGVSFSHGVTYGCSDVQIARQ